MTVWYYAKWNEIYIRGNHTMWTVVDKCTVTILVSDIKCWNNFVFLGEL